MKKFTPLVFLASLGAGGISIIPFAFFNYSVPHAKGLIKIADIAYSDMSTFMTVIFRSLEGTMILFTFIHIILSIIFFVQLIKWLKDKATYKEFINNPLSNSAILAPFISIAMTMNVFIGPVRYFIPEFAANLQTFMFPALLVWSAIWISLLMMEIKLLKISFSTDFDISKIHFGWLLHPFALGMVTVTGTGIAALAADSGVAGTAAFMSLITGTMGLFLLMVKLVTLFKSHFASSGLPEKQFLPSLLIVVPNITLYAISIFRFGHYLEKHHGFEMGSYFLITTTVLFAFEVWYMLFGLSLLKDYFSKHFFKEFHVSQWGLICPLVAFAVLGSFVYSTFIASPILYYTIIITTLISIVTFFALLIKHAQCAGWLKNTNKACV